MSCDPQRFAYSSIVNRIMGLDQKLQYLICSLIGKVIVTVDPADSFGQLRDIIIQKIPLAEELVEKLDQIDLSLEAFVAMLQDMIVLDKTTIDEILKKPTSSWVKAARLKKLALKSGRPALL